MRNILRGIAELLLAALWLIGIGYVIFASCDAAFGQTVRYGGRTYNAATYRGCSSPNCSMCAYIRSQRTRATSQPVAQVNDNSPTQVRDAALKALRLMPSDTLIDFGCGDGNVLIAAVRQYGCRAVGIENDVSKATTARQAIREAGLADSITVITGDVLTVDLSDYGGTHGYCYLFDDLLSDLAPRLRELDSVVSVLHNVPELPMTDRGEFYLYEKGKADDLPQTTTADGLPLVRILDHYAEWCGPCRQADKTLIPALLKRGVPVRKFNVDKNNDHKFDAGTSVRSIPYFLMQTFDEKTRKYEFSGWQWEGADSDPDAIAAAYRQVLGEVQAKRAAAVGDLVRVEESPGTAIDQGPESAAVDWKTF